MLLTVVIQMLINKTMRNKSLLFVLIALFMFGGTSSLIYGQSSKKNTETKQSRSNEKGTIQLFNGRDLSNWSFFLKDPAVDPATVFTVQNGVIHIKGDPFGYMRTKDIYSEYKLHVEWRYPVEASNSGVFIHANLPDTIWLRTFECQLKAGSAGDFVCMNGATMNEQKNNSRMVPKMANSSEKPVGEWNTLEVTCKANTIEVYVNGVLQNKATGTSASKGYICLQSEGKEVEFKNVFITQLPQEKQN
jgi:3-keto-disaccharide hydrolase